MSRITNRNHKERSGCVIPDWSLGSKSEETQDLKASKHSSFVSRSSCSSACTPTVPHLRLLCLSENPARQEEARTKARARYMYVSHSPRTNPAIPYKHEPDPALSLLHNHPLTSSKQHHRLEQQRRLSTHAQNYPLISPPNTNSLHHGYESPSSHLTPHQPHH